MNMVTGQQLEKKRKTEVRGDDVPSTSEAEKPVELEQTIDESKEQQVEVQALAA
jgi:hypothetical protein